MHFEKLVNSLETKKSRLTDYLLNNNFFLPISKLRKKIRKDLNN